MLFEPFAAEVAWFAADGRNDPDAGSLRRRFLDCDAWYNRNIGHLSGRGEVPDLCFRVALTLLLVLRARDLFADHVVHPVGGDEPLPARLRAYA